MDRAKQIAFLLAALVFTLCCLPGLAETFWVQTEDGQPLNIRDESTNQVIGQIPDGAALTPDPDKSTDISAYVTYEGQSGFVLWRYLTRTEPEAADGVTKVDIPSKGDAAPEESESEPADTVLEEGEFIISVTGATVSLSADGQGETSVVVGAEDVAYITAQVPEDGEVAYWVFNGVRYDFSENVTTLRVESADRSWEIEAVPADGEARTQLTAEAIQEARTGETLIADGVRAELSHVDASGNPDGDWRISFNFTRDYQNQATRRREDGGQVSVKVRAVGLWNQFVVGWKFDETAFYPNAVVSDFVVRHLNTSMTYEPIFGSDTDMELPKVTVTCVNCTFTGGGYSNATSGKVTVGTPIHVTGNGGSGSWDVNGSLVYGPEGWALESYSIDWTVTKNTVIVFYLTVN